MPETIEPAMYAFLKQRNAPCGPEEVGSGHGEHEPAREPGPNRLQNRRGANGRNRRQDERGLQGGPRVRVEEQSDGEQVSERKGNGGARQSAQRRRDDRVPGLPRHAALGPRLPDPGRVGRPAEPVAGPRVAQRAGLGLLVRRQRALPRQVFRRAGERRHQRKIHLRRLG